MFLTNASSQSRIQAFGAEGMLGWGCVELATQTPVVWVEALTAVCDGVKSRTILAKVYEMAPLFTREDLQISAVRLLSPGYLNGSGEWAFDEVEEIWRCISLSESRPVLGWTFVLSEGREYVYCSSATTSQARRDACLFTNRTPNAALQAKATERGRSGTTD